MPSTRTATGRRRGIGGPSNTLDTMNRLGDETSPYLRQHADNPVDWFPWGPEAFEQAAATARPILLSVGYSSCHWCHVMAHESFEDPATAAVMNRHFVNIKVDREEQPDVDAVYMDAVQATTGRGGWPMTVFCTPDGRPFFGGTYFPPERRGNAPSFVDVLERVAEAWESERDEVEGQAERLTAAIGRAASLVPTANGPSRSVTDAIATVLRQQYDAAWGGFGRAPKFPQTMCHEALLRVHHRSGDDDILTMVTNSLDAMASGGIYDHLGGGFARYSTDQQWLVPHFEKMLYDNALFVRLYLHAWQVTGKERYLQVVDETIGYMLRDLRNDDGGFFSAEDADSEGEEGKYYIWTDTQIASVLGDDAAEFCNWFGVAEGPNFEGRSILWRPVRGDLLRPVGVELSRQRLLAAREMRIRPGLDDKVLTEWNGLAIAALAEAALATANHQWLAAATRAGEFLLANLRRHDGRWLRSWHADDIARETPRRHLGVANDLAAVVDAFTRLGEASGQARWIGHANEAADQLLELFWDDDNGGVFTTGADADPLVVRTKDLTDNAVPSANSAAAVAFVRLGALAGRRDLVERANRILALVDPLVTAHPAAFAHAVAAIDMEATGLTEVVVPGDIGDLLDVVRSRYRPNTVVAWGEPYESPLWQGREVGKAHVCADYTCLLPTDDPAVLDRQLSEQGT